MNITITGNLTFLNGTLSIDAAGNVTYAPSAPTVTGTVSQSGTSSNSSPVWAFTRTGTPVRRYTFTGNKNKDGSYGGKVVGPPQVTGEQDDWTAKDQSEEEVMPETKPAEYDTTQASAS